MSFTDGKPRVATAEEVARKWAGRKGNFRCRFCGHAFAVGDVWRFVFANFSDSPSNMGNFFVCSGCDSVDVLERAALQEREFKSPRWWWFRRNLEAED